VHIAGAVVAGVDRSPPITSSELDAAAQSLATGLETFVAIRDGQLELRRRDALELPAHVREIATYSGGSWSSSSGMMDARGRPALPLLPAASLRLASASTLRRRRRRCCGSDDGGR
jgi:hypothetical protein